MRRTTKVCLGGTISAPDGNGNITGTPDAGRLPTPVPQQVVSPYPYTVVPVRGSAPQAMTVILAINGASNPIPVAVSTLDSTFCADVPLPAAAQYDIALTSQSGDGRTSPAAAQVEFVYDPKAPDIPGLVLCHGEQAHR
jgi:hypothetical protein